MWLNVLKAELEGEPFSLFLPSTAAGRNLDTIAILEELSLSSAFATFVGFAHRHSGTFKLDCNKGKLGFFHWCPTENDD